MQKIETVPQMRQIAAKLRAKGHPVALLPTLGALHTGHASLIRLAKAKGASVVVSAFVNPLQFGPSDDYARYPRTPQADAALCEQEGVDALFTPSVEEMLPKGYSTFLSEDFVSKPLCGVSRPAFFRGTLTCWLKLLNIVQPALLVMGEKDAQLVAVMRKVASDLQLPVEISVGPTVRDADGFAISSRNAYLSASQRDEALAVYRALVTVKEMLDAGARSADRLVAEATHILAAKRRLRVIYIAIVNRDTMEAQREVVPGQSLLVVSYWVDEVRLTDNLPL
jgi:pantoate--beta-alanine ligase